MCVDLNGQGQYIGDKSQISSYVDFFSFVIEVFYKWMIDILFEIEDCVDEGGF